MPSDDIAISVRNVTKNYRLFGHPGDRIKQFASLGLKQYHREFTALKDVSFDIKKGETVGIIGRNGSGKSTLLQIICGILKPTSGTVNVNGRVSALLELGAGFNPEFTGRENVYFQGAIMGFTRQQMHERFDAIAAFADIGEFIDQPVRTYSSGMFVRLAFAVAIHVDPEVLVVDEALAVGDMAFQQKCFARIHDIRSRGGSILLVTHALEQVAHFCDRALLLDRGHLLAAADTTRTLASYLELTQHPPPEPVTRIHSSVLTSTDALSHHPAYNPQETRWGDRAATVDAVHLYQDNHEDPPTYLAGLAIELKLWVRFHADVANPVYGLTIKSAEGAPLFSTNSRLLSPPDSIPGQQRGDAVQLCFSFHPHLDAGEYSISLGVVSETPAGIVPHDRRYDVLRLSIQHPLSPTAGIAMKPSFRMLAPA